jgi:dipeptidyl aminopeptidase/acylaminoacyl peptidase
MPLRNPLRRRWSGRAVLTFALAATASAPALASAQQKRTLRVDDLFRLRSVRDPNISPDGQWVAYVVSQADSARDKSNSDIYMTSWDGTRTVQLTHTKEGESSPRWSPDGKYLSFIASRGDEKAESQVWLLDRSGGEAFKLTDLKEGVGDYEWSPDSKRLVLVSQDSEPKMSGDSTKPKTPKPIVINRYHFKRDVQGYLGDRRNHLYLFDIAAKKAEQLTSGPYDDADPSWSPDGTKIAFRSSRIPDPDRANDDNIYVIDARPGAQPQAVTTFNGPDEGQPAWSPDGRWIAYLQGSEPQFYAYSLSRLAIVPSTGGEPRVLTSSLDRAISSDPIWSKDGTSIVTLVEDDRSVYVARVNVADGKVERLLEGRRAVQTLDVSPDGKIALLSGTATQPNEVYAFENGALRPLSKQNDAWIAEVQFGTTEDFTAKGKDGTVVNGLLTRPPNAPPGKLPMLLRIHGGPNGQDQHSFSFEREWFAANGYAVLAVNYRGSSGRGAEYQKAIFADWGNKEVKDLLAAVDEAVASGVADPDRLGIGGWSYGGILTNYTIATDTRFKAATSGAGSSLQTTMFGTDQYIYQYEVEVGQPWKNPKLWEKLSYPFWHADRIKTPTLFMGGEKDFNVPITGSEQMYMALKSQGIDTELVVYPGQYHGISIPSYQKDRLLRYLAWYDRYLKPKV